MGLEKKNFKIEKRGDEFIIKDTDTNEFLGNSVNKNDLAENIKAIKLMYDCKIDDKCLIENFKS